MEHPSLLKETSMEIFSGLARSYERALEVATACQDRTWKAWVGKRLSAGPGGVVLDVGCGTLVLEERLRSLKCRFVGIDLSMPMLRIGQAKGVGSVSLLAEGDAESLPFPEGAFDSAVSCYVPKYVDSRKFAGELARVVKPGGSVILYDFARPRGAASPLLHLYTQGGLRVVGAGLRFARREEAATFDKLPLVIGRTRWDDELPAALELQGVETLETARLTGGTVFAYHGRKRHTF